MKKETKIRKMLGNDYHLSIVGNNCWKLFRKYKDWDLYISEENETIMTSETHTEKELYKFAKKNRKYDIENANNSINIIVAWLCCIVIIINVFIKIEWLRYFIWGIDFYIIINCIYRLILMEHNHKVFMNQIDEEFKLRKRIIKNRRKELSNE